MSETQMVRRRPINTLTHEGLALANLHTFDMRLIAVFTSEYLNRFRSGFTKLWITFHGVES